MRTDRGNIARKGQEKLQGGSYNNLTQHRKDHNVVIWQQTENPPLWRVRRFFY